MPLTEKPQRRKRVGRAGWTLGDIRSILSAVCCRAKQNAGCHEIRPKLTTAAASCLSCHHSLGIITAESGFGTALAAGLTGTLAAGLEAARRSMATLRSDGVLSAMSGGLSMAVAGTCNGAYLLVGVHAGEATAVACLAALGRDLSDFLRRASNAS
jgi:hypothetical protein